MGYAKNTLDALAMAAAITKPQVTRIKRPDGTEEFHVGFALPTGGEKIYLFDAETYNRFCTTFYNYGGGKVQIHENEAALFAPHITKVAQYKGNFKQMFPKHVCKGCSVEIEDQSLVKVVLHQMPDGRIVVEPLEKPGQIFKPDNVPETMEDLLRSHAPKEQAASQATSQTVDRLARENFDPKQADMERVSALTPNVVSAIGTYAMASTEDKLAMMAEAKLKCETELRSARLTLLRLGISVMDNGGVDDGIRRLADVLQSEIKRGNVAYQQVCDKLSAANARLEKHRVDAQFGRKCRGMLIEAGKLLK